MLGGRGGVVVVVEFSLKKISTKLGRWWVWVRAGSLPFWDAFLLVKRLEKGTHNWYSSSLFLGLINLIWGPTITAGMFQGAQRHLK